MAKIVTITNPLTGQPVQVDQLYHTAQDIDNGIDAAGIESADYPGCYYRMVGGVVEWLNPPMSIGVEYRTTERYNGKPVYVKAVDCGAGPNNTEKSVVYVESSVVPIDFGGYMYLANKTLSMPWTDYISLSVSATQIIIIAKANYSGYNAYVWAKYYKTTD